MSNRAATPDTGQASAAPWHCANEGFCNELSTGPSFRPLQAEASRRPASTVLVACPSASPPKREVRPAPLGQAPAQSPVQCRSSPQRKVFRGKRPRLLLGSGVVVGSSRNQAGDKRAEQGFAASGRVMHELEEAEVKRQLVLRDAAVRSQPGAQQRPEALCGRP